MARRKTRRSFSHKKLGLFLAVIGAILVIVPFVTALPYAQVIVDTRAPEILCTNPAGTTSLPAGSSVDLSLEAKCDIWSGAHDIDSVVCKRYDKSSDAEDWSYVQTYTLELVKFIKAKKKVIYGLENAFTLPDVAEGEEYSVKLVFVVTDKAGNRAVEVAYVIAGKPTGYFTLNGIEVSDDVEYFFNTTTFTVAFVPTAYGDLIQDVYVSFKVHEGGSWKSYKPDVMQGTWDSKDKCLHLEQLDDGTWVAQFSVKPDKLYRFDGFIDYGSDEGDLQLMSLIVDYEMGSAVSLEAVMQVIGALMVVVGAIINIRR